MNAWKAEAPPLGAADKRIERFMDHLLGKRFPGINANMSRAVSLYRFLLTHRDMPARNLAALITEGGKPLFSEADLSEMLAIVKRNSGSPFSQRLLTQVGGADTATAATVGIGTPIPTAKVVSAAEDQDPSRSKFWDKMIRKIFHPITSRIPPAFDGILWYMFILYHLEQVDFIGPFIASALDTVTLSLPVLADLTSDVVAQIVQLAPIPYAGFIGDALGYMIALVLVLFAISLNIGRKHFGSAFKAGLEVIPLFGDVLAEASQSFEIAAERYMTGRAKILKSVDKYSPHTEDVIAYWTPSTNIVTGPPVYWNTDKAKMNLIEKATEELGLEDAMSIMEDPTAAISGAVANASTAASSAAANAAKKASNAASGAVGNATAAASNAAKKASNTIGNAAANAAKKATLTNKKGGSRQTRRRLRH